MKHKQKGNGMTMNREAAEAVLMLRDRMEQADFDAVIALAQNVQKRNPFGSEQHIAAYEIIRVFVALWHGNDIGEYE